MSVSDSVPADPNIARETRTFLLILISLVAAFVGWAWVSPLDVVSEAVGEVIPSSQVKSIQHLEGGIVRDIMVQEGDYVTEGQPLVALEGTSSGADVQELRVRIAALQADGARLRAERSGADAITFPPELMEGHDELIKLVRQRFHSRRTRLRNEQAGLQEAIQQRRQDIKEISARLKNTRSSLRLQEEQVKISEDLLKDDLTNRMLHLNLLKEANALRSKIQEDTAASARARAALKEAELRLQGLENNFQDEVQTELDEQSRSLEEFTKRLRKFEDSLQRTVLRSPVNGVVKTLYVYTVGGVVRPGGTVADVVPREDRLVIEARLAVQDVGYVHPGQSVRVKLASSDAARFGDLKGSVVNVSPDTVDVREGAPYYKVRVETEYDRFSKGGLVYKLVPGVQVTCAILTGHRSVLEYVLDPFFRAFSSAMRER